MKNRSVLPETAPEEPVSGPGINGNRKEKFTVKRTALAILLLLMAALCLTARAEITDHEAICDADGVTYYYLTAGHSPEHFGSVWYGGTELPPRQVILEGTLPEGLFLEWDEQEVRLAGTALKVGTGCFTVTVLYESPESGYGAIRSEYIYCVTEEPVRERLARSGYDFSVSWIPDTLSPGFYAGEDGYIELYENGSGIWNVAGQDEPVRWDDSGIYAGSRAAGYEYGGGRLFFAMEGGNGDDPREYFYSPKGDPEAVPSNRPEVSDFFSVTGEEPYFIYGSDGQNYGFEEDFLPGCSVWCAVEDYRFSVSASSVLAPQGQYSYDPANICSSERGCAWVEGAEGYGVGEYVEITRRYDVCDRDAGVDFTGLCVVNGYARNEKTWRENSRVKQLVMWFNGCYVDTFCLEDTMEPQFFDLNGYALHAVSGADSVFRFEIASVYPGERYRDTALTGIEIGFWTPNH